LRRGLLKGIRYHALPNVGGATPEVSVKNDTCQWLAPVAACLLMLGAGRATAGPDNAAVPAPAAAAKQSQEEPVSNPPKVKATQHAPSLPQASAKPEATPAPVPGVSGALSPEQSAALAHQRLRRCQLHPGTCEQSKGAKTSKGETSPESTHSKE
jgi:hypothetical protein